MRGAHLKAIRPLLEKPDPCTLSFYALVAKVWLRYGYSCQAPVQMLEQAADLLKLGGLIYATHWRPCQ